MSLEGRGRNYGPLKAAEEWALGKVFGRGWPAAAARALGLQGRVQIVNHRLVTARWPAAGPPLRVAFASDLHGGPTTHPSLLDEAARALEGAGADLLLLGGDYVYLSSAHVGEVAARLAGIAAPLGKFAVLGNHDLWADDRAIRAALEEAGIRVLVNEQVRLPPPYDHVTIAGLDDPYAGTRDVAPAFAGVPDGGFRLLLVHAPEVLMLLGDERFDLGLCGHTHGGHIALPGGIPVVVAGPLSRRYGHGRHDLGDRGTLIVSRGIGATQVPFRWNADPDVLVVDIVPGPEVRAG
jgi:hypothetical protein